MEKILSLENQTVLKKFNSLGIEDHCQLNGIGMFGPEQNLFLNLLEMSYNGQNNISYTEIGSSNGGSALLVYFWAKEKQKHVPNLKIRIDLIDIKFPNWFYLNMKRAGINLQKQVDNIKINCHELSSSDFDINKLDAIDVLFIDGYHSYSQVLYEYRKFGEKLNGGGLIISHDHSNKMNNESNREEIIKFEEENRSWLEEDKTENFYLDEAFLRFLKEENYSYIDTKIDCYFPHRTGLSSWVRKRTSPSSALAAIRKPQKI